MNTDHLLTALTLSAALLIAGCGAKETAPLTVPESARAGDLTELQDCEYQPSGSKARFAAECGTLVVPENWETANSRLIALPVVRIPASGPDPAEPVFFLAGGPGASNLSGTPPDWILKNHDAVSVGYRGVEGTVRLDCPDVNRLVKTHIGRDLFSQQARSQYAVAVRQCAATHQEAGVDLSGYTIPGVAEDMEAARTALGYERINLFAESYGTRVAQIYAYIHPDSLYRLVLIGVNTPGHFIWRPADLDRTIVHISELCAKAASCSRRTRDLAQTMYEVNRDMPKRWLFFNIDPNTVRFATHMLFFSSQTMPLVFDAYLAAGEGDPSGLAMLNLMAQMAPMAGIVYGDQFSKGGTIDLEKYGGLASVSLGHSIMGAPLSEAVWPMGAEWPIALIPNELREFQQTDVELLLVNGTVDFSTPPAALDEAQPYFHKAQMVLLPEFSHTGDVASLQPEAFERLITSYYDTGVADNSLFVYQPLSYAPRMSAPLMAKLLVAAMVVLPALIIWGAVAVVRRVRRRPDANR